MKKCSKCNIEKEISEFHKDKRIKDGHRSQCKGCVKGYRVDYYEANKDHIKAYYQDNRVDKLKYQSDNKEKRNEKHRNKILTNHLYKLKHNTHNLILSYIKRQGYKKKSKTLDILGCNFEELKDHLEDNPYGFTLETKAMDLDHIIPISQGKTEEDVIRLNHYTNFQLLPSEYNQFIKSDNEWDKDHFEKWLKSI